MKTGLSFLLFSVILALPSPVACVENIEVLFDGTGAAAWDVARDAERLRREFSVSEVKAATNPPTLAWRFISRGVAFNDLFLRRRIGRDFTSIRVRIRNEGAAVTLAAKVLEASGAEWTTRRIPLTAGGDWQWVEFARPDWHAAGWSRDADGRMDFPLEYVTLFPAPLPACAQVVE